MKFSALVITAVAGTANAALAAGEQREDGSGLGIAIFLAFCALIIVGQLLPIFRTRIRQRRLQRTAEEAVTVHQKQD